MIKIPCKDSFFWMDGILKANLDSAKSLIKDDWDFLYIIDGEVGCGKSVFAQQMAYYVSDGKFKLEQVCFSAGQFREAVLKAEKYEAIVFDEAFRGLSGRSSLSKTNKHIVELLNEIRQKNLFIFIVLPSMWDLDKYVTQHRSSGVFHVYYLPKRQADGSYTRERGHVRFYKKSKITYLVGNSRIRYVYPKETSFKITFREFYPLNEKSYKRKKSSALQMKDENEGKPCCKFQERFSQMYTALMDHAVLSQRRLSELTGIERNSLRKWGTPAATLESPNPKGLE